MTNQNSKLKDRKWPHIRIAYVVYRMSLEEFIRRKRAQNRWLSGYQGIRV